MEHVLEEKEECELREHGLPRGERHLPSAHSKRLGDGMEEKDLWAARDPVNEQINQNG